MYDINSRSDKEQGRIDKWEAYIRENNNKKGGLTREPIDCFHKSVKDIKGYDRGYVNKKRMYDRILIRKKSKKTKQYHIKVRNIVMGVPITFLDKYNPKQFEILGLLNSSSETLAGIPIIATYDNYKEIKQDGSFTKSSGKKTNGNPVLKGKPKKGNYYINKKQECVYSCFSRIVIQRK